MSLCDTHDDSKRRSAVTPAGAGPATPETRSGSHRFGFWAATFVMVAVMTLSTAPSPLYAVYARRDHFSALVITVIYAAYALGVILALLFASHLSDVHGRRIHLAAALLVAAAAFVMFLVWPALPGLFAARVLSGVAVGLTTATATAYLRELHLAHRPQASTRRPAVVASAALFAGFAIGALLVGLLAQYLPDRLTMPYLVLLTAVVAGGIVLAASPETRPMTRPLPAYRPQRVSVPAEAPRRFTASAAVAVVAFAGPAVYCGLAGTVLDTVLHDTSLAMVGLTLFILFGSAVGFVLATSAWSDRRLLAAGSVLETAGVAVVVTAVSLPHPGLVLFLVGGGILGAAAAGLFKAALGSVSELAGADTLGETLAGFYLLGYIGLSVPAVAVGIALRYATARTTLAVFGVCVLALLAGTRLLTGARSAAPSAPQA